MARKPASTLDDLVAILSRLPWWISALIGLVSWLSLSRIAVQIVAPPSGLNAGQLSGMMLSQLWHSFAMIGQYLIPVICLIGAIGSIAARRQREKLLIDVQNATQPGKAIDGLNWQQFEQLIGEAFRVKGYSITETGDEGADNGIDLILRKSGEKYLVQCKHWRALKVGVPVVREFFGAMAAEGAAGGFVVTSGQFTSEARAFATGRNIELIDGTVLKRWFSRRPEESRRAVITAPSPPMRPPAVTGPACPLCNGVMVRRVAKRGAKAGKVFWGCSKFPGCKGVLSI